MLQVELTSRETWIRIQGQADDVEKTVRFIQCMQRARNQGIPLDSQSITFALQAFADGKEERMQHLFKTRIDVSPGKHPVYPRTFGQFGYVQAIRDHDICFGVGPAGTGKTYLAMALAVSSLIKQEVSRIIMCRPAIEAGEALGFLPGDMHQKVLPYLRPLYDALHDVMNPDDIEKNFDRGIIEVAPLAYMRGRTLNGAFVILDEAQNTTPEQMLMFLTRLGFDSKCVVTGDLTQVDLPKNKQSGLLEARNILRRIPGIAYQELDESDVVRHALVQKIILAYKEHRENAVATRRA